MLDKMYTTYSGGSALWLMRYIQKFLQTSLACTAHSSFFRLILTAWEFGTVEFLVDYVIWLMNLRSERCDEIIVCVIQGQMLCSICLSVDLCLS